MKLSRRVLVKDFKKNKKNRIQKRIAKTKFCCKVNYSFIEYDTRNKKIVAHDKTIMHEKKCDTQGEQGTQKLNTRERWKVNEI